MFVHLPDDLVDGQVEENKDGNFPGTNIHQNMKIRRNKSGLEGGGLSVSNLMSADDYLLTYPPTSLC